MRVTEEMLDLAARVVALRLRILILDQEARGDGNQNTQWHAAWQARKLRAELAEAQDAIGDYLTRIPDSA